MILILLIYHISSSNISLREEFDRDVKKLNMENTQIISKMKENLLLVKNNFYEHIQVFKNFYIAIECSSDLKKNKKKFYEHYCSTAEKMLTLILNLKLDIALIKFILSIKLDTDEKICCFLVPSFCTALLIQNLFIVFISDKKEDGNKNLYVDFLKKNLITDAISYYNHEKDYTNLSAYLGVKENRLWISLFMDFYKGLQIAFDEFNNNKSHILEQIEKNSSSDVKKIFSTNLITKRYSEAIKNLICSIENWTAEKPPNINNPKERFYFLFNHRGFRYNRISYSSNIVDLYATNFYKKFIEFPDIFKNNAGKDDIDISYLEGKNFQASSKEEFEFIMGLLEYASRSYKKHIICMLKKDSFDIEIIKTSLPIEMILDHYKEKHNITEKIKNNPRKYADQHFCTITEGKIYSFKKNNGDIKVSSKCLQLKCSHILGHELLVEYFSDLSEKCYFCGAEFMVEGYFEADLYVRNTEVS